MLDFSTSTADERVQCLGREFRNIHVEPRRDSRRPVGLSQAITWMV
jgi:hypothetical protein